MKALILCSALFSSFLFVQSDLSNITDALRVGDTSALSYYMDKQVEINIGRVDDVYDKEQAVKVLDSFFTKYTPSGFKTLHHGASNSRSMKYYIGILRTNSGSFRSTILLEEKGGKMLIKQFALERA